MWAEAEKEDTARASQERPDVISQQMPCGDITPEKQLGVGAEEWVKHRGFFSKNISLFACAWS